MYTKLHLPRKVRELAEELKKDYKLDNYQALQLAVKIEQNEILSRAFVLSNTDEHPTALEKLIHTIQDK